MKNATFSKNEGPGVVFLSIFAGKGAADHFFIVFLSIFVKKINVFLHVFFERRLCFSQPGEPLNLCTGIVFSAFFTFFIFLFFQEKTVKNPSQKASPEKQVKISSPGPLWDAQITQNGTRGGPK